MRALLVCVLLLIAFVAGIAVGVIGVAWDEMRHDAPVPWDDEE
jgi:hypothetical protein